MPNCIRFKSVTTEKIAQFLYNMAIMKPMVIRKKKYIEESVL